MIRNLLTLFFLSLATFGFGQLMISADTVTVSGDPTDPDTDFEIIGHAYVVNTSNQSITFDWYKEDISIPTRWTWAVCDVNSCYPDFVVSSAQAGNSVTLAPGDTSIIDAHVYHEGEFGVATLKVTMFDVNDNTNAIGEINYVIKSELNSSSEEILKLQKDIVLFPNPTYRSFHLKNDTEVSKMIVYNTLGRKIKIIESSAVNQYYVGDLPAGLYLISFINERGQTLKTSRLIKRTIMP